MTIEKCPICNSDNKELILEFKNSLQFVHNKYNSFTLEKNQCLKCAHIYTTECSNYLLEEHYESTRDADDILIFNTSEDLNNTFNNIVNWMVNVLNIDAISINGILDIGCGRCDLLKCFSTTFDQAELFGIDYSPQAQKFGKAKGINNIFIGDLYSEVFNNKKFDIISATGVMEHQVDLSKFITKIVSVLNINGYLVIEVPDRISILKDRKDLKSKSMHDICNDEHIHHFNSYNLIELLRNYGFKLLGSRKITRGDWDDINIVMQYNGEKPIREKINIDGTHFICKTFHKQQELDKLRLESVLRDYNSIAIYGAGWHTTKVLPSYYELDFSQIDTIFDQDPRKIGKKIYGTEICAPE